MPDYIYIILLIAQLSSLVYLCVVSIKTNRNLRRAQVQQQLVRDLLEQLQKKALERHCQASTFLGKPDPEKTLFVTPPEISPQDYLPRK